MKKFKGSVPRLSRGPGFSSYQNRLYEIDKLRNDLSLAWKYYDRLSSRLYKRNSRLQKAIQQFLVDIENAEMQGYVFSVDTLKFVRKFQKDFGIKGFEDCLTTVDIIEGIHD